VLTLHDPSAILYPRVAQRAVLPEAFRRPYALKPVGQLKATPINKEKERIDLPPRGEVDIALATDALFLLDPREFGRGHHDEWLSIMNSSKFEGTSEDDFVRWSLQDPDFAGDEAIIRRKWHSLSPSHGGALWAALAERGYKLKHCPAGDTKTQHSFIDRDLLQSASKGQPFQRPKGHHLDRIEGLRASLRRDQREPSAFWHARLYGEILYERGTTSARAFEVAQTLLEDDCRELIKAIGLAAVRRSIQRGFHKAKEKFEKESENE
jgi:hypothetical protein